VSDPTAPEGSGATAPEGDHEILQQGSPPRPARSRRLLPLIVAGALVLVLAVGALLGNSVFRPHLSGEHPATLSTPPEVAGLVLATDPFLEDAAVQMSAALTSEIDFDDVVAAFYHDPADDQRLVLLAGGTAALRDPGEALDDAFGQAGVGVAITSVDDVDPGPMGGTARCGATTMEDLAASVCGWADHGSVLVAIFLNRSVAEGATLLRDIRAEILVR
jgi:hypothetical protein